MTLRRIKRMDGIAEEVTKPVEVSKLIEPKFLTLTEKPANQTAFKVIRDDTNGEAPMTEKTPAVEPTRRRRIRSTQRSSLLFVEFPEGATDEEVTQVAVEYGLEEYEVTQTADGRKCLKRSDLPEIPKDALTVGIGGGRKAGVVRAATPAPAAEAMPYIETVAVEFDKAKFATEDAVMGYLQRYDIDFLEQGVENTDKQIRVVRSELAPDAEIRRVEVETGVVAVVTRAAVQEVSLVPSPFTEIVCEECYGQWGWGQLDFNAIMADIEFCEAADEATYRLRNLIERILFYSQLPIIARKELVNRACTQFGDYVGALLDGLPSKVVLVNRSTLETKKETQVMTQKTNDPAPAAAVETAAVASVAATAATDDSTPITRSELKTMIAESIATALASVTTATTATTETTAPTPETVARADDTQGEGEVATAATSVDSVAKSVEGLAATIQTLVSRMDTLAGSTTVRSDSSDSVVAAPKTDVFAGIFSTNRK
jgi:hypothetical protein